MCLIWTQREREAESENELKIGRGRELHHIRHSNRFATVEPLASPIVVHRCFGALIKIPSRI